MKLLDKLNLDSKRVADLGRVGAKFVAQKAMEHSSGMLALGALGGLVATAVLAAKATPVALELRGKRPVKTDENGEPNETKAEAILADAKAMAPAYIPAVVSGTATAACIICGKKMSDNKISELNLKYSDLAAAYTLSEKAMSTYKKEVIDRFGEEVHDDILEKVGDKMDECPFDGGYITGGRENGDTLFYDYITGMVFWSTEEKIRAAEGIVTKNLMSGPQTICDLYSAMGVRDDWWDDGQKRGWTVDGLQLDIRMSEATMEPDGKYPKRMLSYKTQALGR